MQRRGEHCDYRAEQRQASIQQEGASAQLRNTVSRGRALRSGHVVHVEVNDTGVKKQAKVCSGLGRPNVTYGDCAGNTLE